MKLPLSTMVMGIPFLSLAIDSYAVMSHSHLVVTGSHCRVVTHRLRRGQHLLHDQTRTWHQFQLL